MQPGDQAALAFVITVFLIFSAIMAYATWLGREQKKPADSGKETK
jgi:hypothetical protein